MSLKVIHDGTAHFETQENCCICLSPTRYWHRTDVALCPSCAENTPLSSLPTKNQWCENEEKRKKMLSKPFHRLHISLMAAVASNGVIGSGPDIPWDAKGEQLLFKAITFGQWIIVGRKTLESMGVLPNRKYVVISKTMVANPHDQSRPLVFPDVDSALEKLAKITNHVIVCGGGEIYKAFIGHAETLHISTICASPQGDVCFPKYADDFEEVFRQEFESNVNYTYRIFNRK
jgi:dihydrofolate reductase (trimethoprim resistance protein)